MPEPRRGGPRRSTIIIGAIVVLVFLFGTGVATFYTDALWFKELGRSSVFWGILGSKAALGAAVGLAAAVLIGVNLWIAVRFSERPARLSVVGNPVERVRAILAPYLGWAVLGVSAFFAFVFGSQATVAWKTLLLWKHASSFGVTDPQFHRDAGYWVFSLPFQRQIFSWLFGSLVLTAILVASAYVVLGGIRLEQRGDRVTAFVKAHLSVLMGLLVLLKAWAYRMDQFSLNLSPRGVVTGASYTDVHAQLPALKLLVVVSVICAVLFLVNIRFRGWTLPVVGIVLLAFSSILIGGLYPLLVQKLRVGPQESQRERTYIARNIEATRTAFGLDQIESREFPVTQDLTQASLENNRQTVDNIRVWDPSVLRKTYQQLQGLRPYYEFEDVDIDRYPVEGQTRQIMLSARELNIEGLAGTAQTWPNTKLVYTHGYGVVANLVNKSTTEGQPDFVLKDIRSTGSGPKVTTPGIYYGERSPAYSIVGTGQEELDFPSEGEAFQATKYTGKGGVPVGGIGRRIAFALRFRDPNILISGLVKSNSRILFERSIDARVRKLAPFLQLDSDPYVAVVDGRVVFIQDAYTTTADYPYSERVDLAEDATTTSGIGMTGTANYIRNSVKAVVDAYNGTVTLYIVDNRDPIVRAWSKAFPKLFTPGEKMSADLRAHLRYPEGLFLVQAKRYASYHILDPGNFYSKEDYWALPKAPSAIETGQMSQTSRDQLLDLPPYYTLMRLPEEKQAEFLLMMPMTPNRRPNINAWLAARMDGDNYGKLVAYVFPKQTSVDGPEQVAARIMQDTTVSPQITLLSQAGSKVIAGNLLVIPIDTSLLYIQPFYVEATSSQIPELKRVAVVFRGQVAFKATLAESLNDIFGGGGGSSTTTVTPTGGALDVLALLQQAAGHFVKADAALKAGDLAGYAREEELGRQSVEQAREKSQGGPAPSASPSPTPTRR
ncbi:MAG: UPF0182 family protein [Actinomycetota bacterium]